MIKKVLRYLISGIFFLVTFKVSAEPLEFVKTNVNGYVKTDLDMAFEIKTDKFEKVVLDCQSFFKEISFNFQGAVTIVPLDEETCVQIHEFIVNGREDGDPVCLGLNMQNSDLYFSYEGPDLCN